MSKIKSKSKYKKPKALTVYFGEGGEAFANEIERIAGEFHLSVSELCTMMLDAGFENTITKLVNERDRRASLFLVTQQQPVK